ncbi:MAG: phosphorylase [Lachnospiraceae bacterium]|nr:phosphorylase [Lachnospiraceae bacterium]
MKQKMIDILNNMQRYNTSNMAYLNFGLDVSVEYDALVVAPGWKPTKIITDPSFQITRLAEHSYISGYLVEKDGLKIAWIQIASGGNNLIDHLTICGELKFKKLIFIGAVGSLRETFDVGDLCTPSYSVAGVFANAYLCNKLSDYKPFGKVYPDETYVDEIIELAKEHGYELKKASVFCTDSIALEYSHLDEIREFGTDLIEMETSSFYLLAELLEVPAIALLIVSDNSATGQPLVGRNEEQDRKYNDGRKKIIPDLIYQIAKKGVHR